MMKYKNKLFYFTFFSLLISFIIKQGNVEASIKVSNDLRWSKIETITSKNTPFENNGNHDGNHGKNVGIPLFIKNNGQWDSNILFRARLSLADLYIRKNGISMVKIDRTPFEEDGHYRGEDGLIHGVRVDMNFDNANSHLEFIPKKKGSFPHHYIMTTTVSHTAYAYAMVYVKSVYQGIDWRIYTTLFGEIKHEFILYPDADANQIKLLFEGHKNLKIIQNKLEIETLYGSIFEQPPYSFYQFNKGNIPTQYQLKGNTVQFNFPENYNKKQFIVIDPTLIFSTYSNSIADNWGYTGTYGENGTGYSAGIVFNVGFPATTGSFQTTFNNEADIGILKYDATGSKLLYATYLGGDDMDIPHSLLLDQNNNLLIYGTTSSINFPITRNVYQSSIKRRNQESVQIPEKSFRNSDIFLARLSTNGQNLLNSTYIGGFGRDGVNSPITPDPTDPSKSEKMILYYNYGDSYRGDLTIDTSGNIYVSSVTESDDFPTTNAHQRTFGGGSRDGILFKMSHDMDRLIWSTYIGGNRGDTLYNMKILNNKIIVCGATFSTNSFLPTKGKFKENFSGGSTPQADGIVIIVNQSTGIVTDATYLGTTSGDQAYFIDSDIDGNIFVLGQTHGFYSRSINTFGADNAGLFLQKLTPDLKTPLLSTTLGTANSSKEPNISPTAFLVSNCGDIYITGFSLDDLAARFSPPSNDKISEIFFNGTTRGLPVTVDAYQSTTDGKDFYLMILSKNAEKLNYATFFGGVDSDIFGIGRRSGEHVDGGTNRFDKQGIVYHAVCAGCGGRNSFPTTPNAFSTTNRSFNCNNGFFKFDLLKLRPQFNTNTLDFNNFNIKNGCVPFPVLFSNTTNGNGSFEWDFGDGTIINKNDKNDIIHIYNNPGVYTVTLKAKTDNACIEEAPSASIKITVEKIDFTTAIDTTICSGEAYNLFVTNANNIIWKNLTTNSIISRQSSFTVSPTITTEYELNAIIGTNCQIKKKIKVTVLPILKSSFDYKVPLYNKNAKVICRDFNSSLAVIFENTSENATNYTWKFGDGITSNSSESSISHIYNAPGTYKIQLVATNPISCPRFDTFERTIILKNITNEKETVFICPRDTFTLSVPNIINPVWYINEKIISRASTPSVYPSKDTVYIARGLATNGCQTLKEIEVKLYEINYVKLIKKVNKTCYNENTVEFELTRYLNSDKKFIPLNDSIFQILFDMGDGNTYNTPHVVHNYKNEGSYTVSVSVKQQNCILEEKVQVSVPNIHIPNVITPNGDNKNDKLIVKNENNVDLKIYDRWGSKIFESKNYQNDWPPTGSKYFSVLNYEAIIDGGETCNGWIEVLSN